MAREAVLWAGSAIAVVWGIAHVVPTRSVVAGFGSLSEDNRRIITMEWVAEGLSLTFIGALTGTLTAMGSARNPVAAVVYRACAAMLLVMAGLTMATGARSPILPMKLCPLVKASAAVLLFVGTVV